MSASSRKNNVVVVGIGAMGGGMARALLDSEMTDTVVGYDMSVEAVQRFYEEAQKVHKATTQMPASLEDSIAADTNITIISLVNESQCEQVCFGGDKHLLKLMPKGSCVVLTSTVTGEPVYFLPSNALTTSRESQRVMQHPGQRRRTGGSERVDSSLWTVQSQGDPLVPEQVISR